MRGAREAGNLRRARLSLVAFASAASLIATCCGAEPSDSSQTHVRPRAAPVRLRSYLTVNGGFDVLNTNLRGDVVHDRFPALLDIGIGHELNARCLLEVTYGWLGRYEQQTRVTPLQFGERLSEAERAFTVTVNPLLLRLKYARDGARTGYFKPEWSLGAGFYQVSRLLRNPPSVPPEDTSQMLPVVELGLSGLFVFDRNLMGYFGTRYAVTRRASIADDTRHFDGLGILIGVRAFLPSPRDEMQDPYR